MSIKPFNKIQVYQNEEKPFSYNISPKPCSSENLASRVLSVFIEGYLTPSNNKIIQTYVVLNLSQNQSAEIFKWYIWPYMIIKKHNSRWCPNRDKNPLKWEYGIAVDIYILENEININHMMSPIRGTLIQHFMAVELRTFPSLSQISCSLLPSVLIFDWTFSIF